MRFKEWLFNELNKGLARNFNQTFSNLPNYVAKETLRNRVNPAWQNSFGNGHHPPSTDVDLAPTIAYNPNDTFSGSTRTVSDIYQSPNVRRITNAIWTKQPTLIEVSPIDFVPGNISKFIFLRFGMRPSSFVRNDAQRSETQRMLMNQRGEQNEPIIVLKVGNKYELLEGWHRTMAYLLSGAPRNQWFAIKNDEDMSDIDLHAWNRVKLRAYVGVPQRD